MHAFIPARGGSRGVPGKNLRTVGGIPLVVRAVIAARAATSVDLVVVSTDRAEIASLAEHAGAEVVERPPALGADAVSSEAVILHALDTRRARGEPDPGVTVLVQCTSPFTNPADIDGTVSLILDQGFDCAFTAIRTHAFVWRRDADGLVAVNHDARERARRQDRPVEFVETGGVYAMRTDGFRRAGHRFFGTASVFEVPRDRALDIDDEEDLARAEQIAAFARSVPR